MTDDTKAPASRETDAAVARAMGWKWYTFGPGLNRAKELRWLDNPADRHMAYGPGIVEADGDEPVASDAYRSLRPYSADTDAGYAAMREVLAWLKSRGMRVVLETAFTPDDLDEASVFPCGKDGFATHRLFAPSLPLAMCRLALAVNGAKP